MIYWAFSIVLKDIIYNTQHVQLRDKGSGAEDEDQSSGIRRRVR
jgi:hypothetical protein